MADNTGAPTMTLRDTVHSLTNPIDRAERVEAEAAIAWYADLIDRLPKTADGVRVVPGTDRVWFFDGVPYGWSYNSTVDRGSRGGEWCTDVWGMPMSKCYSTKAAAEAASRGK